MKTIGLLGGTGWESTVEYYKIINQEVAKKMGKDHSAKIIMFSIDFYEISSRIARNDFESLGKFISETAEKIERSGAECLVVCANTLHMFAEQIAAKTTIPLIHIADCTAEVMKRKNFKKACLLGTRPTMEMPFYKNRLKEKHGIDVIVPDENDITITHNIIVDELLKGIFRHESKHIYLDVMKKMVKQGAECIILGCTDIPLLLNQSDTDIILLDTLEIHAKAAVDFALQ
jgi:aspartate racemase